MSTTNNSEHQPNNPPVRHWKSLEEWQNDPEVQKLAENEFMSSPFFEEKDTGTARREFLKLMGASLALTSAGCIRRPVQKIIPYVNRPDEMVLGVADYYTSSLKDQGEGFGIIVKTREGRPIKIEGNPAYPLNEGGLSARAHAHVLSLYDPDRLKDPKRNLHNESRTNRDTISTNWEEIDSRMASQLKKGGVVVLTSSLASPSTDKLIGEFVHAFSGKHVVWDAVGADDMTEANRRCYGDSSLPLYRFDEAELVISIDGDFLGTLISPVAFAKQFATKRNPDGDMNRLVAFESMMTLTGQNADERYPIRPSDHLDIVMMLIHELVTKHGANAGGAAATVANYVNAGKPSVDSALLSRLAAELWAQRGKSLVISGGLPARTAQAVELQMAVNLLNWLLENDGKTINHKAQLNTLQGSYADLRQLIDDMNAGKVNTLIMYKANPAYSLPKSAGFIEALNKVGLVLYAGENNETALVSDFMAPVHHDMENWGDSEFVSGVLAIQQPTIRPLHNTRAFEGLLLGWMKQAGKTNMTEWHDYLQAQWRNVLGGNNFNAKWDEVLQKGVYGEVAGRANSRRSFRFGEFKVEQKGSRPAFEIVLYQKIGLGDGHLSNMPWMQEFPDPVTKIVWDNYVNVAPATALELKLKEGDIVELKTGAATIQLPVHIQPGVHRQVLAVAVGYGRNAAGKVGTGVGKNAYKLVNLADGQAVFSGLPVEMKKTGEVLPLANVQGHQTMFGRDLVFETTYGEYQKNKKAGHVKPHFEAEMWPPHKYPGHKWGMAIDVNLCTGCSACVVACQAENNIPVVGKKYVLQGREMHWLRIDRYYSEHPDNPETVSQLMLCQHCDNAPCETVCPVVATSHSTEGLNEMTYNRCVGTRYCSNNCPYKVRRFNWFAYDQYREPQQMVLNPEVTVRSRGVMEKCTFCVQRIKEVKNVARDEERPLKDGEVMTACQQSCPTKAIVFGDTNDPDSLVSKIKAQERAYVVLEDLNTKSAIHYMTKVRNRAARDTHQGGHH